MGHSTFKRAAGFGLEGSWWLRPGMFARAIADSREVDSDPVTPSLPVLRLTASSKLATAERSSGSAAGRFAGAQHNTRESPPKFQSVLHKN